MKIRRVDYSPQDFSDGLIGHGLGRSAIGTYWLICSRMYADGTATIDEAKAIAFVMAVSGDTDRASVQADVDALVAAGKLTRRAGGLHQKRVEAELRRAASRIEKAASNGRRGGRPPKDINGVKPDGYSGEKLSASKQQATSISQQPAVGFALVSSKAQPYPADAGPRVLDAAKIDPTRWLGSWGELGLWEAAGFDFERDVLPAVAAMASRPSYSPPRAPSLRYFEGAVREQNQRRRAGDSSALAPAPAPEAPEIMAARRQFLAACEDAKSRGLRPGSAGYPKREDFGLVEQKSA